MDTENLKVKNIISKSWSGMLFLLFLMMLTDITECGINNDFSLLIKDPGVQGLYIISTIVILNIFVQVSIFIFNKRIFRKLILVLTALYTLFFITHQIIHLMAGEKIDIHFYLDISHHILGIIATTYTYKWTKSDV